MELQVTNSSYKSYELRGYHLREVTRSYAEEFFIQGLGKWSFLVVQSVKYSLNSRNHWEKPVN